MISLCGGNKKDGFWEVNVTLFNRKNLSLPHSSFQCKGVRRQKLVDLELPELRET